MVPAFGARQINAMALGLIGHAVRGVSGLGRFKKPG